MKPFSLEAVLNYKQRLEDIAKNRLFKAQQAEYQAMARLREQDELYVDLVDTAARRQLEGVGITELIGYEEHIQYVKNRIQTLQAELTKRHEKTAAERENLLTRSKEKQAMEKLKEKQNTAWRQYLNKKEAAMLDEIAIIYHDK
jgi:flagellar protein FliJ